MSDKMYGLYVVKKEEEFSQFVACSGDINKLISVVFPSDGMYHRVNDSSNPNLKFKTTDDIYPIYLFREIPFII